MVDEIKRVNATQLDADLTSIANAIRNKGMSGSFSFPEGMVEAIQNIPTDSGEESSIIKTLVGNYTSSSGVIYFNNCPLWVSSTGENGEHIFTFDLDYIILAMNLTAVGSLTPEGPIEVKFVAGKLVHQNPYSANYSDTDNYYSYIPNTNYNYVSFNGNCNWDGYSQLSFTVSGIAHASPGAATDFRDYDPSIYAFEGTIWYILKSDLYTL